MLFNIGIIFAAGVLAQSANFCFHDYSAGQNIKVCFEGWPAVAAVCPNHSYRGIPYGYFERGNLAQDLYLGYPSNCQRPDASGRRQCTLVTTVIGPNQQIQAYATLMATRTVDRQGQPTYHHGGMYWLPVRLPRDLLLK